MKEQLWRWGALTALWLAATTTFGQAVNSAAQTPESLRQPSKVLTLQDCLRLAESAPSAVSVAEQERAIAGRDLTRARAAFMPRAEMLNGFIYNSPRLDDRSTFSFLPANGVREYTTFGAVTQEFDTSGRLRAQLQRARAGQDAARVNFDIARRDLRRAVTVTYYRLLLTRHLVAVVGDALKESQGFESRAKLLFEGGEAARADLVKASAQVAFLLQALNAAELEAKLANQELASFWTKDVDEPLRIADALEEPAPAPADESQDDVVPFRRRLEFSLFDAERRGFQAEEKIARSALKPQFGFVFQYGLDSSALRFRDRGYAAYFTIRIPVFDWFRARGESQQFQLRAEQVETNRAVAERTFSREYRGALARVKQLYEQIRLTREQVRLAEEDLQLSRVRYEGGEGSALDVVTSQNQLAQARNNYYASVANYLNARTDLEAASGK
ncbi:MAG TPA: TolC family protein [Blastocatellia bacterium]|nr:TolC family protein [Blastocatellia bacterium]